MTQQETFEELFQNNILIYGTGKIAENLISNLRNYNIVGVLDGVKTEGTFYNYPILELDELDEETADSLIIAATPQNQDVIYERIHYYCKRYNIKIYNLLGHELSSFNCYKGVSLETNKYFHLGYGDLIAKIDQYETISFDFFDTLVTRRVMFPRDIYNIVEREAVKQGICITNFKKKRIIAENESRGGNIDLIYALLQKTTGISVEEAEHLKAYEISCEKKLIAPRQTLVDAFNYAVTKGKKVYIISNMYLPLPVMEELAGLCGVQGYTKMLVSCEYGCSKSNGLFEKYKKEENISTGLHIGDNEYEDGVCAKNNGLESFLIYSGYKLLENSSYKSLLYYSTKFSNRIFIGRLVSELFNDPFILKDNNGLVKITNLGSYARAVMLPITYAYLLGILKIANDGYDKIIFPARDGYFFQQIFEYLRLTMKLPQSVYLIVSRKVGAETTLFNPDDIEEVYEKIGNGTKQHFLLDLMEFDSSEESEVIKQSEKLREEYSQYLKSIEIDKSKKYLFCDLISRGNTQRRLDKLFDCPLDGYYLCKLPECYEIADKIDGLFTSKRRNNIALRTDFIERFFTAPTPSARRVHNENSIEYVPETRSREEISALIEMQNLMLKDLKDIFDLVGDSLEIENGMLELLIGLIDASIFDGEMLKFLTNQSQDSITLDSFDCMRKIYH